MEDLLGFNSQRQRTALRLRLPKLSEPHQEGASSISLPGGTVGWLWNLRLDRCWQVQVRPTACSRRRHAGTSPRCTCQGLRPLTPGQVHYACGTSELRRPPGRLGTPSSRPELYATLNVTERESPRAGRKPPYIHGGFSPPIRHFFPRTSDRTGWYLRSDFQFSVGPMVRTYTTNVPTL